MADSLVLTGAPLDDQPFRLGVVRGGRRLRTSVVLVAATAAVAASTAVAEMVGPGVCFGAAGLVAGALFLADRSAWLVLLASVAVTSASVHVMAGDGWSSSTALGIGLVAEAVVAVALYRRLLPDVKHTVTGALFLRWSVAVVAAASVGSTIAVSAGGGLIGTTWQRWLIWTSGDALTLFAVAPLIMLWGKGFRPAPGRGLELLGALTLHAAVSGSVFLGTSMLWAWLLAPTTIWLAYRFGSLGSAFAAVVATRVGYFAADGGTSVFGGAMTANRWLHLNAFLITLVIVAHVLALTVQRANRLARSLVDSEAALHAVVNEAPIAMVEVAGGTVVRCNRAAGDLLGRRPADVVGGPLCPSVDRAWAEAGRMAVGDDVTFESWCDLDDGSRRHLDVAARRRHLPDGSISVIMALHDDTASHLRHDELQRQLHSDPLTGLANRVAVGRRLDELAAADGRLGVPVVLYCDLDGFKLVNDTHGHEVGDQVLIEVARRIRSAIRPADLAARLGGDEFVVVAAVPSPGAAGLLAARVRRAVRAPLLVGGMTMTVGVSVGVAVAGGSGTVQDLLAQADRRMYTAKARSRPAA
jgi:diguanylate cyclase (GGDEF)-like protein